MDANADLQTLPRHVWHHEVLSGMQEVEGHGGDLSSVFLTCGGDCGGGSGRGIGGVSSRGDDGGTVVTAEVLEVVVVVIHGVVQRWRR